MAPARYDYYGEKVLRQIDAAPEEVRREFIALLEGLRDEPHYLPGKALLGVLPFKDARYSSTYTAPFDDALLLYRVMADYPLLYLIDILWLPE